MIKYLASGYFCNTIKPVEIIKENDKSVWIKGERIRHQKTSSNEKYCDTWQEAKEYLIEKKNGQILDAKRRLEYLTADLEKINAMEEPK